MGSERPLRRNARATRQAPADGTWIISSARKPLSVFTGASKDRLLDASKPGRQISDVGAPRRQYSRVARSLAIC